MVGSSSQINDQVKIDSSLPQILPSSPPRIASHGIIPRIETQSTVNVDQEDEDDLIIMGESVAPVHSIDSNSQISNITTSQSTKLVTQKRKRTTVLSSEISTISNGSSDNIIIEGIEATEETFSTSRSTVPKENIGIAETSAINSNIFPPKRIYSEIQLESILHNAERNNPKLLKEVNVMSQKKPQIMEQMTVSFDHDLFSTFKQINPNIEDFIPPVKFAIHHDVNSYPSIRFMRTVRSVYYRKKNMFIPVPAKLETEELFGLYFDAKELPDLLKEHKLGNTIRFLTQKFPHDKIIIFVSGYDAFLQHLTSKINRKYVDQVRSTLVEESQTSGGGKDQEQPKKKRRKKKNSTTSDDLNCSAEDVETKFLQYEFDYGIHFMAVKGLREFIEWIKSLSYTLASRYLDKDKRNKLFANIGQMKSGRDEKSSLIEMTKQFKYMTSKTATKFVEKAGIDSVSRMTDLVKNGRTIADETSHPLLRKDVQNVLTKVLLSKDERQII